MVVEKVPYTLIDMKAQKVFAVKEAAVYLHDSFLIAKHEFEASFLVNEDDEMMGWEDRYIYEEHTVPKQNIASLFMFLTFNKQWCIMICVNGSSDDIKVYFETKAEAEEFKKPIANWLLP